MQFQLEKQCPGYKHIGTTFFPFKMVVLQNILWSKYVNFNLCIRAIYVLIQSKLPIYGLYRSKLLAS